MSIIQQGLVALKTILLAIVANFLPHSAKRAMFMTIMYIGLAREGLLHDATLEKLNEGFKLVSRVEALELPAEMLSDRMLEDIDFKSIIQEHHDQERLDYPTATFIGQTIANKVPNWIHYEPTEMIRDARDLLFYSRDQARAEARHNA